MKEKNDSLKIQTMNIAVKLASFDDKHAFGCEMILNGAKKGTKERIIKSYRETFDRDIVLITVNMENLELK